MNRVGSSVESTFEATGLLDTSSVFFCYWWDEVGADPCVVAVMSDSGSQDSWLGGGRKAKTIWP